MMAMVQSIVQPSSCSVYRSAFSRLEAPAGHRPIAQVGRISCPAIGLHAFPFRQKVRLLDLRDLGALDADPGHQALLVEDEGIGIFLQR